MPEYERTISVRATPEDVFQFVSDVHNLPKYLPTTHQAEGQGQDRVRVQGEVQGHHYDSDGWFRVDPSEYRMEWGSDGENDYSGWLEVEEGDDRSEVTVHLSFQPKPTQEQRFEEQMGSRDALIEDGLLRALESIQAQVERHGGKVESPVSTSGQ